VIQFTHIVARNCLGDHLTNHGVRRIEDLFRSLARIAVLILFTHYFLILLVLNVLHNLLVDRATVISLHLLLLLQFVGPSATLKRIIKFTVLSRIAGSSKSRVHILVNEPAIVTSGILITIGGGNILQVSDFLLKFLGLLVILSQ
jgi:hypothetical protein